MVGLATPNISQLWHPFGEMPINVDYDGTITSVDPGSDAAKAGIKAGDTVDLRAATLGQRLVLLDFHYPRSGDAFTLRVRSGGTVKTVTLRAESRPTAAEDFIVVLRRSTYVLFVGIAAFIVLRRPDRMTWAFYLYALAAIYGNGEYFGFLPAPVYFTITEVQYVLLALGNAAFLLFAARFPNDRADGWAVHAERLAPYAFGVLALSSVGADVGAALLGRPSQVLLDFSSLAKVIAFTLALATLIHTFLTCRGQERQRIKIVMAGLVIAYGANVLILWIDTLPLSFGVAFWWDALGALNLFIPLTVAYGVLRYRIMDVNFILSRALVYGTLTTGLVALFALIDWLIGTVLASRNIAVAANVAAAIIVGLSLNGVHHRIEHFIAGLLFRRRHAAARRLAQIASALPHANDAATIASMLVAEPVAALSLASAALFRRDVQGRYDRIAAHGWPAHAARQLDGFDALVVRLRGEQQPFRTSALSATPPSFPQGEVAPILAVPIVVRRELEAVALYGAHSGGEDLDPDELRALERIGEAAGAAYYHVEADALRNAIEQLGREIEAWRARAVELGWKDDAAVSP